MKRLDGTSINNTLSVDEAYELEDAISYMWKAFTESGPHPKPVRVHSLRIALALEADGTDLHVVIAALFHDLIEDTAVTVASLKNDYGSRISDIVIANSYSEACLSRRERDIDMYQRCVEHGPTACLVKAADLYDNSLYFFPVEKNRAAWFREKMTIFSRITEPLIGNEPAWMRLHSRAEQLNA